MVSDHQGPQMGMLFIGESSYFKLFPLHNSGDGQAVVF
jgi:hypothetical protein